MEDSLCHSQKFDKIKWLLVGVYAFVIENVKGRVDIIFEDSKVLEVFG